MRRQECAGRATQRDCHGRAGPVARGASAPALNEHDALLADTIADTGRRPRLRHRAGARAGGAAGAVGQAAAHVDRAGQPSHRHSARRGAAQPAHAREAGLRRRRRRAPVLPAPARAVVQPRLSVGVAARGARAADPRSASASRCTRPARWRRSTATRSSTSRARRRRASCRRASTSAAAFPPTARRSGT